MAREGEVREQHCGLRAQKRPLPGMRPAPLLEVLPQLWAQRYRRSMVLCRLWWNNWWTCSSSLTRSVLLPSRLSTCPKIFIERIREPQLAETAGGSNDDHLLLHDCFFERASGAADCEQNVDIPAVGGGELVEVFLGFLPGLNSSVTAEQNVDNPVRPGSAGVAVKIFSQSRAPQRLPRIFLDKLVKGFFALFPGLKKSSKVGAHSRSELASHSSSSTPGAYGVVSPVQSQQVDQVRGLVELQVLDGVWQSLGHGVARLLRHSKGAVFFQFWLGEQPIVDDVVQSVGRLRLALRPGRSGRTWARSDPENTGGPPEYGHAVPFASQELARRFHHDWAATG